MKVLFFLQLKRALKAVPKLIAGAVIPLFFAGMAVFWAQKRHTDATGTLLSPVALVNQDTEAYLDFVFPFITNTDAAGSFSFTLMEEQEAMTALKNGTVCAVLLLPPRMFSGILDSTNIPARLYLPEGNSFPSLLLAKFAEAGALTLGSSQAGIYAASDLYSEYGLSERLSDIYYEINLVNLKYALGRESVFSAHSTTATGELSLPEYYGGTLFLCLLLFFGAGMGTFLCNALPKTLSDQLRRHGIGSFCIEASLFLPLLLFYLLAAALLCAAASLLLPEVSFSPILAAFLFCVVLCLSVFTQVIFSLFQNAGRGLLAFSFLGLFMIFLSGGFLPYAFLPASFSSLTPFLPLGACLLGFRKFFGEALGTQDILLILTHTAALCLLLWLISFFRRKEARA
ncbi:MAG: ABC transporter permease [Lachnospiraceae bacterium]|nr:ABC transporter permease [Lachnospiraceae bacterium]